MGRYGVHSGEATIDRIKVKAAGIVDITTDAAGSGSAVIKYGTEFDSAPILILTPQEPIASGLVQASSRGTCEASGTVTGLPSATVKLGWIAVEPY